MGETTEKRQTSTGQCAFCGGTFGKAAISRHLRACKQRTALAQATISGRQPKHGQIYHLQVEGRHDPEYWLHLEVPGKATLADLDQFLRDIWLECCGHLSAFTIDGVSYSSSPDNGWSFGPPERSMRVSLSKVLRPDLTFAYEYDFGSTTHLKLRVVGEREGTAKEKTVEIMARNSPPEILCVRCEKPATQICTECLWSGGGWLCDQCLQEHECGDEMALPVVNSPRVGVCGYTG